MYNTFRTLVEIPENRIKIKYSDPIVFMGSCFAEHIANRLSEGKFKCITNPFGVLYNPASISEALRQINTGRKYNTDAPELLEHDGLWHSLMHHSSFSGSSKEECLTRINDRLQEAVPLLKQAKVLFITFGSAYAYRHKDTGLIAGNCHKLPEQEFLRLRLSPDEIVEDYTNLIQELRCENPNLHMVFTVSPIRHLRDGLHGNQVSKATLLLAIERLVELHPSRCIYFPAYELMMDDLRDYRFYADDMMHPSSMAIEYIWEHFMSMFLAASARDIFQTWQEIRKGIQHRPFNPNSKKHKQFLTQLALRIERFKEKYPTFDVENELTLCRTQLNK